MILKLWYWLWGGHEHQWEEIHQTQVVGSESGFWRRYHLRCRHCGEMKFINSFE